MERLWGVSKKLEQALLLGIGFLDTSESNLTF